MEDQEFPNDKIFCQQCGLPLEMNSYEIKNENTQSEIIFIKLKCKNFSHKLIVEMNFEDFNESIKKNYKNCGKCKLCNSIFQNNMKYCTHCNGIICENCYKFNEDIHNDIKSQRDLDNKCLLHINDEKDLLYYCTNCKRQMCEICINSDKEHFQNKKIDEIYKLKDFAKNQSNINKIKIENESLLKRKKILENKIDFNEFLINEFETNNNFCLSNINKSINIIYHDSNFKKNGSYKNSKLKDCKKFESGTQGNVIMTDDITNLNLLLKYISKNNSKSKFILIVNGAVANEVIYLIRDRDNNYESLFICACIYTQHPEYFNDLLKNNSDLIKGIFTSPNKIIEFINNLFKNLAIDNEKYYVNPIISIDEVTKKMIDEYFNLFKEISESYGDESQEAFKKNMLTVNNFVKNEKFPVEIKNNLIQCFQTFSVLPQKNYEKIISCYLNDINFSKILNLLLENKDISIYKRIKYFVGNLMHSIVQYGKKMKKGVVQNNSTFYRGLKLNIIEFLEFLKNNEKIITFPYFQSVTKNKECAELSSNRKSHLEKQNSNDLYSVIMTFNYSHQGDYEPSIYELKDLSQFPDEEEHVILPFTYMKVSKITTDSLNLICDIELEIIGKKEILESNIGDKTIIKYDFNQNIMRSLNED